MTGHLLLPPPLKQGDVVGLAAPAGPFSKAGFFRGLAFIKAMGLSPRYSPAIFERDGFLAGPDSLRAQIFNELLADPEVKAVFCVRGGYGSMRILHLINLDLIRVSPKIIVGFSDITALLLHLHLSTSLVTFHGPLVTTLGEADEETRTSLKRTLFGQGAFSINFRQSSGDDLKNTEVLVPGRAEGPLLGGNLSLLVHLLAAGIMPDLTGAIIFLEDTGEAPYRLDRMLTALKLAGIFSKISGLILGRFDRSDEEETAAVLMSNLTALSIPVIVNFPIGHGSRNLTLPIGPKAVLDTREGLLKLREPFLSH